MEVICQRLRPWDLSAYSGVCNLDPVNAVNTGPAASSASA